MAEYIQKFNPLSSNFNYVTDLKIEYYDATIGVGGTYETLEDVLNAIDSGVRFFKAVGNVENSTGLTSKSLAGKSAYIILDDYYIDFGNIQITGNVNTNITIIGITSNARLKYSTPTNYTFYGIGKIKLENVKIIQQAAKVFIQESNVFFENVRVEKYNGSAHILINVNGYIKNIEFVGGGTSCQGSISNGTSEDRFIIENITFSGTYQNNASIFTLVSGKVINMNYNSSSYGGGILFYVEGVINTQKTLILHGYAGGNIKNAQINKLLLRTNAVAENVVTEYLDFSIYEYPNITFKNCIINQAVTQTSALERQKYFNCVFNGNITMLGDNNIFENNKMAGNFTYTGDYGTITQNRITGATTLQSGSEYNIITGNFFTGGITNNSGNTTNEINNNIG